MNQINLPELAAGEINAGIIMKNGKPDYWLILLAGDNDDAPWDTQMAWAKDQGGDLPTLPELNLLRANAKDHFKQDWYWSNTQHATYFSLCLVSEFRRRRPALRQQERPHACPRCPQIALLVI
jgi:hypothetical protein